jgi:hypothetical protein
MHTFSKLQEALEREFSWVSDLLAMFCTPSPQILPSSRVLSLVMLPPPSAPAEIL